MNFNFDIVHNNFEEFKKDIFEGLSRPRKEIASKYFYDELGSDLFTQITCHPDYYLTRCEIEILNSNKQLLSELFKLESFQLIELGPGDGTKTIILLEQFSRDGLEFTYHPIDISANYLKSISEKIHSKIPLIKTEPIHTDFLKGLESLSLNSVKRNVLLFLGSSIGNYDNYIKRSFLESLRKLLHPGDYVLIGFDLQKEPEILMRAYKDNKNITRDFNLNLLRRINRELAGNFDLEKFIHQPVYNADLNAMESYLVSTENQNIKIEALEENFKFETGEAIHVESSYKYLSSELDHLAMNLGFDKVNTFIDSHHYFADCLWRVPRRGLHYG